jgi:hypothetical protein
MFVSTHQVVNYTTKKQGRVREERRSFPEETKFKPGSSNQAFFME